MTTAVRPDRYWRLVDIHYAGNVDAVSLSCEVCRLGYPIAMYHCYRWPANDVVEADLDKGIASARADGWDVDDKRAVCPRHKEAP